MIAIIQKILGSKGFTVFTRPFELNIIGIRSENPREGFFDDEIHVFYTTKKGEWEYRVYKASTDAGSFLGKGDYPLLAEGQYLDSFQWGEIKGIPSLMAVKPLNVIVGYNRKSLLDVFNGRQGALRIDMAFHPSTDQDTKEAGGLQVFEDQGEFAHFMRLCELHKKLYGNSFTYTLLDMRSGTKLKRLWIIAALAAAAAGIWGLSRIGIPTPPRKKTKETQHKKKKKDGKDLGINQRQRRQFQHA